MTKKRFISLILVFFTASFLSGCSLKLDKFGVNVNGPDNPTISDSGKTYLDSIHDNIAAFDKLEVNLAELNKVYKLEENGSIYYFAADGKRYIFPTETTYFSWYQNNLPQNFMALDKMEKVPLGGNVTVRPGTLISTPSDSNTYLVKKGGMIAPVSKGVLMVIFGEKYDDRVLSLPNYYFTNYTYDTEINKIKDYPLTNLLLTIDIDKGLDETTK